MGPVPVPDRTEGVCTPLVDDKFIPKLQEPCEPAFDLNKLKIELNNITIMYGPPDATIRQAERAMLAYINALCEVAPVEVGARLKESLDVLHDIVVMMRNESTVQGPRYTELGLRANSILSKNGV